MTTNAEAPARSDGSAAQAGREATGPGVFEGAGDIVQGLRGVAHDYLVLAGLETKRAGQSIVIMIAAGVMMAILLVSAWLGLVAAGVFGMVAGGMALWLALLLAVAANLLVAGGLYGLIRFKQRYLAFPAMLRNLRPAASEESEERAEGVH